MSKSLLQSRCGLLLHQHHDFHHPAPTQSFIIDIGCEHGFRDCDRVRLRHHQHSHYTFGFIKHGPSSGPLPPLYHTVRAHHLPFGNPLHHVGTFQAKRRPKYHRQYRLRRFPGTVVNLANTRSMEIFAPAKPIGTKLSRQISSVEARQSLEGERKSSQHYQCQS
jgi:hypothetical protein